MKFLLTFFFAFGTWVIFSGKFDVFHLVLGVLAASLVAAVSGDFFWGVRHRGPGIRLKVIPKATGYFFWLVYEIFLSNLHVLTLAFHPRLREEIEPTIVRFKTQLKTDFGRFVLGNSITLTPGTVTLKIRGDEFTIHAISHQAAAGLIGSNGAPSEMERRVAEVFES